MEKLLFIGAGPNWLELQNELSQHYELHYAATPPEIQRELTCQRFCAVLTGDLILPEETLQLCEWLKVSGINSLTPLLVGTHIPVAHRVLSFNQGVSDILTDPVDPHELLARLRVRIQEREYRGEHPRFDNLILLKPEEQAGYLIDNDKLKNMRLTGVEYKILSCLVGRPDRIWTRDELLNAVWSGRVFNGDRNIDVHISNLRKKLGPASCCLRSVYGVGYALAHQRGALGPL